MFKGFGSVVNAALVAGGGIIGILVGRFLKERFQETILKILGFAVIVMAIGGTLSQMLVVEVTSVDGGFQASLDTQGTIMMVISLAIGAFVGELIDLNKRFESFGTFLRDKSGSKKDPRFVDAFMTASLTVCIGAMAIIGSIREGISGDASILITKALIDFIVVLTMSASLGKGCIFASVPVLVLQGSMTFLASFLEPIMTAAAISNITLVGNVLILCVGINMVWQKTVRVANVLPAIIVAVVFAFI